MTQTKPPTWLRPLTLTLGLLLACSPADPTATDPPPAPPPPAPLPAPVFELRPAQATVNPLQTVQFEATMGGQPVAPGW